MQMPASVFRAYGSIHLRRLTFPANYSSRRTRIGSMRAARRAGRYEASVAVANATSETSARAVGSVGRMES